MTSCQWSVCWCVCVNLLEFAIQVVEFCLQFLAAQLQFTQRYDFCLIRIQQAFALPLYATLALQELFVLGGERGQIVVFGLCPALVEVRQERWSL